MLERSKRWEELQSWVISVGSSVWVIFATVAMQAFGDIKIVL